MKNDDTPTYAIILCTNLQDSLFGFFFFHFSRLTNSTSVYASLNANVSSKEDVSFYSFQIQASKQCIEYSLHLLLIFVYLKIRIVILVLNITIFRTLCALRKQFFVQFTDNNLINISDCLAFIRYKLQTVLLFSSVSLH